MNTPYIPEGIPSKHLCILMYWMGPFNKPQYTVRTAHPTELHLFAVKRLELAALLPSASMKYLKDNAISCVTVNPSEIALRTHAGSGNCTMKNISDVIIGTYRNDQVGDSNGADVVSRVIGSAGISTSAGGNGHEGTSSANDPAPPLALEPVLSPIGLGSVIKLDDLYAIHHFTSYEDMLSAWEVYIIEYFARGP
jgi:hypothetical protein